MGFCFANIAICIMCMNDCKVRQSSKAVVWENGLFAKEQLDANEIILSVKQEHTLCFSTVPRHFRQAFQFMDGVTFQATQHQTAKTIVLESQLLGLYLIHLKCSQQPAYQQWLDRPINGLYYFDRKVIEQTENLDLLINYVALHNHLSSLTNSIFDFLSKQEHIACLRFLMNSWQCQLQCFRKIYVWSYHFINSRSFGYTKEYTLIPIFDMMNHSSHNDNVQQIVSDAAEPSLQIIQQIISQSYEEGFASDNDSQEETIPTKNISAKFLDLYYHVIATETIRPGEEILIKYGSRNNMFLLQGYGFVEEYNRHDSLIAYFSTTDNHIHYDSVRGAASIKCKLKRYSFDFDTLVTLKKYYYSKFYGKDHKKCKALWSVPKDKEFERYFLYSLLKRMREFPPQLHYFTNLNGYQQLSLWEKQRRAIFQANLQIVNYLYKQLDPYSQSETMQGEGTKMQIPQCIAEYASFLKHLAK